MKTECPIDVDAIYNEIINKFDAEMDLRYAGTQAMNDQYFIHDLQMVRWAVRLTADLVKANNDELYNLVKSRP